jgi:hypothetical protein
MHRAASLARLVAILMAVPTAAQPATATADQAGDAATIARHIQALTDPAMAGRRVGTQGAARAADYIEEELRRIGLGPLFRPDNAGPFDANFRQPVDFKAAATLGWQSATIHLPDGDLELDPLIDFRVFQSAGGGVIDHAPITFVGYSIVAGERGYLGYPPRLDLEGRVALAMRFEPIDELGRSLWTDEGWTISARVAGKVTAAARRNAEAVLLFTPPDAEAATDDLNDVALLQLEEPLVEVPAMTLPTDAARRLIEAGDPEKRSLDDVIAQANRGPTIIDLEGVSVSISVELVRSDEPTFNIGGILPGRGPLAGERIVIGAHYDGVGLGREKSRRPDRMGEIHPGADENASGVAGVLLAAEHLARVYDTLGPGDPARSIVFVFFTLGMDEQNGAKAFLDMPRTELRALRAMINLDMIGSLGETGLIEVGGRSSSDDLTDLVIAMVQDAALGRLETPTVETDASEHTAFDDRGIPNLLLSTGLTMRYLTPDDTADTIDNTGAARIAALAAKIAQTAATRTEPLLYNGPGKPAQESEGDPGERRLDVRVGLIPAADTGMDNGVRVARVQEGTSADEGGLKPGDRLIRWNDNEVRNIADFSNLLLDHDPGDTVRVTVIRGGKEVTTSLILDDLRSN